MDFVIRDETPRDLDAVRTIHNLAFGEESPGCLADDLRQDGKAVFSLVAERTGRIIGHVLFSRVEAPMRALVLAPVGVHPDTQKQGIGSALTRKGLERARAAGWQAVFVLGSPKYYPRFGFDSALAQDYDCPYKGPAYMALFFDKSVPRTGRLIFPKAFDEDIREHIARRSDPANKAP